MRGVKKLQYGQALQDAKKSAMRTTALELITLIVRDKDLVAS